MRFRFASSLISSLAITCAALSPALQAQSAVSSPSSAASPITPTQIAVAEAHIERNLSLVHLRERAQASTHELGFRWAQIGAEYANIGQMTQAESAYNHAIKIVSGDSHEDSLHADVLDQLGALYRIYGRIDESIRCYQNALAIREPLGDPLEIARSRAHLAELALFAHHYKEAYTETEAAFNSMSKMHDPDDTDRISALIVKAYALCGMRKCRQGLTDAQQALSISNREFPGDTMQVGASLIVLGYLEQMSGDHLQAESSLSRAVTMMQSNLAPSDPRLVFALEQHRDSLASLHRRDEAGRIQQQLASIARQPNCNQCTINAAALRTPVPQFPATAASLRANACEAALSKPPAMAPQAP